MSNQLKEKLKDFDIELQYRNYLNRVNLHEESMAEPQRIETKRAFMAGLSTTYILSGEHPNINSDEYVHGLRMLNAQLNEFWGKEI